jgi:REP element-mobilizing transposase RayT
VTVCAYERELTLAGDDVAAIVTDAWRALPGRFPEVALDEFVVMPNHVHGIVVIREGDGAPLGKIMRAFKSISAIAANRRLGRAERSFWQRNYYERVVRSETELIAVRQYIRDNPLAWDVDPENPDVVAGSGRR